MRANSVAVVFQSFQRLHKQCPCISRVHTLFSSFTICRGILSPAVQIVFGFRISILRQAGELKRNPGDLNPHYAPRLLARYYTDLVFAVGRQRRIASDKPRLLGVGGRDREGGGGGKKLQSRPERNQKEQMAVRLLKNYFPRRRAFSPRERLATNFPRSPSFSDSRQS